MKPKKLIWKLLPTALVYLSITFICIYFVFSHFLTQTYREGVFKELKEKTHYLEEPISLAVVSENIDKLAFEVEKLRSRGKLWITVLDGDGKVLTDSEEVYIEETILDNRPEIIEALTGEESSILREAEHNRQMNYIHAHPLMAGGLVYGILRVAVPESSLQVDLTKIKMRSLLIAALVSLTGFVFFLWSALKVSIPLTSILKTAKAISKGDLSMKVPMGLLDSEEVRSLNKYVTRMGKQLKANLAALEQRESEQRAVLSAMDEGVLSVSPDKKILQVNSAMRRFVGIEDTGDLRGRNFVEVFRSPKINEYIELVLSGHNIDKEEFTFDGDRFLLVQGGPLFSNESEPIGAFLVFYDLTEIKTLERYRKEFVSNISHELRTPITAIQGYLETLEDGKVEDKETQEKFLKIIRKQAGRLSHIVEDLLKLSQIETGSLEFEWQDIRPVVNSAVDICKERAEKKKISIIIELEKEVSVKINQSLLQQGLINLIDNAIKYSPEGSQIMVTARDLDGRISLEVKDQGPGISEEHHERLFERFYSVDKARSKDLGGSGIGLAIVKHIARAHGGQESVISKPGEGSTFSIVL